MADDSEKIPSARDPRRIFVAVFVALCLVLAAGYYAFLRGDYTVLYTQLKPGDAAAIVSALDAKGISHKLRDGGTTILVPSDQADNGQLAVAGSDVPLKGSVGFELFNKSDMGLTDFAQKINYQRALQGELARSIMMMGGIENARVHLALPEHTLFRTRESAPRAAVEVMARDGQALGADRVAGIQELIASAVPDLPVSNVVVLDGDGRIISTAAPAEETGGADSEQAAVQNYYSARAKAALATAMPGVEFAVHTLVMAAQAPAKAAEARDTPAPASDVALTIDKQDGQRNFQLRVTVLTPVPLNADDQQEVRKVVADAVMLNEALGDSLSIAVGPAAIAPVPLAASATTIPTSATPVMAAPDAQPAAVPAWQLILFAGLVGAGLLWLVLRGGTAPSLSAEERDAFVARLRRQLENEGEAHV